jgi:hypothetical protein
MSTSSFCIAHVSRLARCAVGPALVALAAWASAADLPKAGSFSVTTTIAATAPAAFDTGGGRGAVIFEARAIAINDAGSGLFHHRSGHCIGSDLLGRLNGVCIYTDGDGDKIIESFVREAGTRSGTGTLIGGTGKYKGIEGSLEFTESPPLADTAPGQRNLISTGGGRYTLP